MAAAATACVLMVLAILIARPEWDTLLLSQPMGAYLLGGLGGLLTTVAMPKWAWRAGRDHTCRVVLLTFYRLLCACLMGGIGFAAIGAAMHAVGFVVSDGLLFLAALLFGGGERLVNMAVLGGLGLLAPREVSSRLL
jgi:hypothetical protein